MKKAAFKGRLLIRKILTGLSLGAVTFIFQACYGPPPPDWDDGWDEIYGTVKTEEEEPIPGIQVSIVDSPSGLLTTTNDYGKYRLEVNSNTRMSIARERYEVLFEDIDGPENGEFEDMKVTWRSGDGPLHVILKLKE